jgi:hypothetical protein
MGHAEWNGLSSTAVPINRLESSGRFNLNVS